MWRYDTRRVLSVSLVLLLGVFLYLYVSQYIFAGALNVHKYSDLITNSAPNAAANHTFTFTVKKNIPAGGYLDFDFPPGFVLPDTPTFAARNVELYVNGIARNASTILTPALDQVLITTGDGGSVRYNLNSSTGISTNSELEFRIGNHTSTALPSITSYSTTTGTTTSDADIVPITNPPSPGNQKIAMTVGGTSETMYADFLISIIQPIRIEGVDTTEEIPPYRFNGAPNGEIGGTTLFVEMSLETDEFAWCRYSSTPDVDFNAMTLMFNNTGKVFHRHLVAVVPESLNIYYIRCVDDEGNFNIDDFIIAFYAPGAPAGTANEDGETEGDGSGSGDSGTGTGAGSGGTAGESDGGSDTIGGSSGGGGSGGGSGGSSGGGSPNQSGGGFESEAAPYPSGDAEVIIRGYAFPGSTIYSLVDGYMAESVRASTNGSYSITISAISRGVYTFGVYAIDPGGTKSSTFSTSFTVTGGRTSNLSNINIMPSVKVSPDPANVGQTVTVSGYAIPNSTVTIQNQKENSIPSLKTFTTTSDARGVWSLALNTSDFSAGTYQVRAKSENGSGLTTNYSGYTYYGVGQSANRPLNADLNRDGRVNLTDFSILLFWWGSNGGRSDPPADINQDGTVSLTDFSILLFNWTG